MVQAAPKFTARDKMRAMQREAGFRRGVYGKKLREGRMTQADHDNGIAIVEEIAAEYGAQIDAGDNGQAQN